MSKNDERMKHLQERAKEASLVRRIVLIVIGVLVVVIGAFSLGTYIFISNALEPVNPDSDKKIIVKIPSGSSVTSISEQLEQSGVIKNSTVFRYYVKYKNKSDGFKAGVYRFTPSMTIDEVITKITSGNTYRQIMVSMTFIEGAWVKNYAGKIAKKTDLKQKEILQKLSNPDYIKKHYMDDYPFLKEVILKEEIKYPLEGYLFPATYGFTDKNPSLDKIVKRLLNKMGKVLNRYQEDIKKSKLGSIHKVLTMASLVEEEARTQEDRRKIAGVFFNRLKKGMPLQTDPSVEYAMQKHVKNLSYKQLKYKSPYNTYKNKGLPPGPIANPGEKAIKAVLNPIDSKALYFFARPNGEVYYSKTYDQHQKYVEKFDDEWDKLEE